MDPSFVFEENSASAALKALKAQPAWELGEAIEEARAVKHKTKTFTTTDEKIRKRLEGKNETNETNETTSAAAAKKKKKKKKTSDKEKDKTDSGSFFAEELKTARNSNESSAGSGSGSFLELNLSRVLCKACGNLGYETPTPVQSASIPLILQGRDVCGSAITGSGKTAAYGLPLLERLLHRPRNVHATYVLVLVPTRELAVQVHSMLKKLGQLTDVRIALVVGGLSMQQQAISLRSRPEIVVATPNRMIDHLKNTQSVDLDDMSTLVLDEADRLLELGFAEQVKEVISHCPGRRQTLLFSATMTEEVQELIGLSLRNPVRIAADPKHSTPTLLTQEAILLKGQLANKKEAILLSLCDRLFKEKTVIFTRTKQYAHRLKLIFGLTNLQASELHGNMSQTQRLQALEDFRSGHSKYLIATDVASRGLDIIGVQNVISFDEPDVVTTYIHRIGRTARAGKQGRAVTFLDPANRSLIKQIMKYSGKQKLKQRIVSDESIDLWAARIADMAEDIAKIQLEEKEERILQKAEMEVLRAENLMQYDQEIMSRPAKAWFQSTREKRELQKAAREEFDMKGKGKGSAAKKKQQTESSGKGANRQKKQQEVSEGFKSMVRAAKNQEKSLKNKGFGTGKAGDIMLASNERKRKRSKASSSEDRAEEQGFKPRVKKSDKMALNRRQRGNRSVKAFKSKKKYKRR